MEVDSADDRLKPHADLHGASVGTDGGSVPCRRRPCGRPDGTDETCDALRRQIGKKAKKNADHYSDPLNLTTSLATPLASVIHVRQAVPTSRTHITSPQCLPGDTKIDLSHRCAIRTMGEVEMSSALAPLSR